MAAEIGLYLSLVEIRNRPQCPLVLRPGFNKSGVE
jgi:hypothetical protein